DDSHMSPRTAFKNRIALIPSERLEKTLYTKLSDADNINSLVLKRHKGRGGLDYKALKQTAKRVCREYDIHPNRPMMVAGLFSGGNQQKVVLAKWLENSPLLVLLDEPTQGVDVGARRQLWGLIRE